MEAGISAMQAPAGARVRWKHIAWCVAAMPFLAILGMELCYKLPLAIEGGRWSPSTAVASRPSATAMDGYAQRSITVRCGQRWPSDRSMQGICARHAEEGLADIARIYAANLNTPAMTAGLANCLATHTVEGITDFAQVGACARAREMNSHPYTPVPAWFYAQGARDKSRSGDVGDRPEGSALER